MIFELKDWKNFLIVGAIIIKEFNIIKIIALVFFYIEKNKKEMVYQRCNKA